MLAVQVPVLRMLQLSIEEMALANVKGKTMCVLRCGVCAEKTSHLSPLQAVPGSNEGIAL